MLKEGVFVAQEVTLKLGSYGAARARLLVLTAGDWLRAASGEAFAEGYAEMARVAPFRGVPGSFKLARVRSVPLQPGDHLSFLPVRWEVAGSTGGLFPVLEADIMLFPAGQCARLVVSGSFRLPLAWFSVPGHLVPHQVATTAVGALLRKIAQQLCPGDAVNAPPASFHLP